MRFNIGDTIGDYRIVELLGAGGMGSVYRVRNVITDREEAMKVLSPDLHGAPELAERFGREIKIQASLEHPNIASLRTAIRVDDQLVMIMELVEGITLESRLRGSPVELGRIIEWAIQLLSALSYAHGRGIIHRDIKPANIMISPSNAVKLTDFGVASMAVVSRLTRTGMAIGSLPYMSPEQIRAEQPDERSDIYSFGITLYEMLSGRRPFEANSEYELMRAHLEKEPAPLPSLNPELPAPIKAAVFRALEKRPEDRFQTAREFQITMESAAPGGSLHLKTPAAGTIDPARIDRVRKELAQYIGPMAKILVDRAAKKVSNTQQLYEMLASEISSSKDREEFLNRRPR